MKIRHLLAGVLALSITAVSGVSLADSRSHTYVDYPITNIPHHGQPHVDASIHVIDSDDLESRQAMRVERGVIPTAQSGQFKKRVFVGFDVIFRTCIQCLQHKTICFSKSVDIYDKVIGEFINRAFFQLI